MREVSSITANVERVRGVRKSSEGSVLAVGLRSTTDQTPIWMYSRCTTDSIPNRSVIIRGTISSAVSLIAGGSPLFNVYNNNDDRCIRIIVSVQ